jgi:hypothetical protein
MPVPYKTLFSLHHIEFTSTHQKLAITACLIWHIASIWEGCVGLHGYSRLRLYAKPLADVAKQHLTSPVFHVFHLTHVLLLYLNPV